jgi:hypothetical protein
MASISKTNNDQDLIEAKIQLRIESLPDKKEIKVLEAYGGEGVLWGSVQRRCPDKNIKILSIDKEKYKRVQLQGDNVKFLLSFNLAEFDIIDLDAYGMPAKQLEIAFAKQYKGVVHCTFIQTMTGNMNKTILEANGYTKKMLEKCQSLFTHNGIGKFLNYLAIKGVKKVKIAGKNRKNYLYFHI